ncbi:Prophage integrase IntS [compost metagenome]
MALTDSWLKAHHKKAHDSVLEKADGEGMGARVTAAGKIVFQMRYRWLGKPVRLDLGTYPLMSLKEARAEHQRLKAELEQGHDPRLVAASERTQRVHALTNEKLYRQWHESYALENKSNAKDILRSFEIHVFPKLGAMPADKTSTHDWMTLIETVCDNTPSIAERLLQNTRQMHKWANRRNLMKTKPLVDITSREDLQYERDEAGRALSEDEIRLVWHATDRSRMTPANKLFIKLCLFFGCRNGELRSMDPVADLDFEAMTWTIPPEKNKVRKKVRRSVVRPLIPEVIPYINEAIALSKSKRLLFTQDDAPLALGNGATLSMPYSVMKNARRHFGVDMDHWSFHDLRKTARSNWSILLPEQPHVAEKMLGHSLQGMQGVYDRYDYLEEQAAAYRAWWQLLTGITAVAPEVVPRAPQKRRKRLATTD